MSTTPTARAAHLTSTSLHDIQGNLVGFNKDFQSLLFVNLVSQDAGRTFLTQMAASEINSAHEVGQFNAGYKERQGRHEDQLSVRASWVNLALTFTGLQLLAPAGLDAFPDDFKDGMRSRPSQTGDVGDSAPEKWLGSFAADALAVHAVVVVAGDSLGDPDSANARALLDARVQRVREVITSTGVQECGPAEDGRVRPGPQKGHEHFGFKDGISQPRVAGLAPSSKPGDVHVAAGEFLIGWPKEDGSVSGEAIPTIETQPGQPGYPGAQPSPQSQNLPEWCKNGSFLVYRRLRQNVQGFHDFANANASGAGLSLPGQLEAKMVGRWHSGAPLERVAPEPAHFDATQADPGDPVTAPELSHPEVLEDGHINNFKYEQHDADGHTVPLAAHIRKTNPRDADGQNGQLTAQHQILRRGIPYGSEVQPGEPVYGVGQSPNDGQDRGLLFLCYQSSITNGFEFIQKSWANAPDFPHVSSGQDPVITQDTPNPAFPLPGNAQLTTQQWVTTTGGEYFFAPSIPSLKLLGAGVAN